MFVADTDGEIDVDVDGNCYRLVLETVTDNNLARTDINIIVSKINDDIGFVTTSTIGKS